MNIALLNEKRAERANRILADDANLDIYRDELRDEDERQAIEDFAPIAPPAIYDEENPNG